jgi:hypothetical protein
MQTYRCQRCGQVLASFITITPQLPLPFSHEAAMAQLRVRQREHRDKCPGAPVKGYLKRIRLPRKERQQQP